MVRLLFYLSLRLTGAIKHSAKIRYVLSCAKEMDFDVLAKTIVDMPYAHVTFSKDFRHRCYLNISF